jgi:hypothetical protein
MNLLVDSRFENPHKWQLRKPTFNIVKKLAIGDFKPSRDVSTVLKLVAMGAKGD